MMEIRVMIAGSLASSSAGFAAGLAAASRRTRRPSNALRFMAAAENQLRSVRRKDEDGRGRSVRGKRSRPGLRVECEEGSVKESAGKERATTAGLLRQ